MRSSRSAFAFGFVTVGCAFGQPPLDSITAGMQDYARGITETRFDVSCKFSRFDVAGTLAKVETKTHSLAFTKGIYKNSSEDAPADWNATWYVHGGRKTLNLALITDSGALFPVFVFSPAKRKLMQFDAVPGAGDRDFSATYRPAASCQAFKPLNKGFGMADIACGSGKIVLDEKAAIPLRGSFEGAGFPLVQGKERMNGFHVESEFATVAVPGAKRPFYFPRRVVADFGFGGGKVTAECDYRWRQTK